MDPEKHKTNIQPYRALPEMSKYAANSPGRVATLSVVSRKPPISQAQHFKPGVLNRQPNLQLQPFLYVGGLLISIRQHIEPKRLFSQSVLNFMVELLQEGMEASDSAKPSRFLRNKYLPVASFCCVSEAVRSKTWKR